jgi:carboxyl-terminal processing protease
MNNFIKLAIFSILICISFQSCEKDDTNVVPKEIAIQNFIWKGLNQYYLWQNEVPNLSDTKFANQNELNTFLYGFSNPDNLFQELLNKPKSKFPADGEAIDRFSVLFSDYTILEGILSGTTKNNGVEFGLFYKDASQTTVFGVVRYILPNSDASSKNIQRGDTFYGVNGETLTVSNYRTLLANDSYTLNLANYDNGNITPNGQSVSLTKTVLSENPILINTVLNSGTHKIGYLVYNGFYPNYESQLNDAFGTLKAQGITELVLDLRYNSGGSIATATRLASMITGQFNNQIFAKEQWNAKLEDYFSTNNPQTLLNLFTNTINSNATINSLNLSKVYVLTTKSTASASELVINGLEPYINVIQIGDVTVGKNVGSITMYDSPTFAKEDINSSHKYAMQPLVLKIVNKVGFGDYINGLQPDTFLKEDFNNLGILGDQNEPLLSTAITRIVGGGRKLPQQPTKVFQELKDTRIEKILQNEMYLDEIPNGFLRK